MTQPVDQTSALLSASNSSQWDGVLTNFGSIVRSAKYKLRGSVVSRADVGDIRFIFDENLCAPEVAQLQYTTGWIQEQVLRLDISMAYSLRMDVCKRPEELINVKLDFKNGHSGFHLVEVSRGSIDSLWNELEDEIEVDFILL
jgi:hypothetical protein